jgi:3-dehydroquinate dehydratase-2
MKLLILNGPNLNLLGTRDPQIYGNVSFEKYFEELKSKFDCELEYYQSNVEGEIINKLQGSKANGIVLNAGGYTHTSIAIRDCISSISIPVVEVHISNIAARESFRHVSLLSPVSVGCIFGFGLKGYDMAIHYFLANNEYS